jgi:hypothetical protein
MQGMKGGAARIRQPRSRTYRIRLAADDVGRLCGAAHQRGVYPETLLTAISRTVLRDALVNAVLDDGEPSKQIIGAGSDLQ